MNEALRTRLQNRQPILLDGPMGSELVRRGVRWRKHGLLTDADKVEQLHAEYLAAGADVLRTGRWGPYVQHGQTRATLPKDKKGETPTLEEAVALITAKAGKKAPKKTRKKAAPKSKAAKAADAAADGPADAG